MIKKKYFYFERKTRVNFLENDPPLQSILYMHFIFDTRIWSCGRSARPSSLSWPQRSAPPRLLVAALGSERVLNNSKYKLILLKIVEIEGLYWPQRSLSGPSCSAHSRNFLRQTKNSEVGHFN